MSMKGHIGIMMSVRYKPFLLCFNRHCVWTEGNYLMADEQRWAEYLKSVLKYK